MHWVYIAIGLFAICGAAFNWEWFMNHHKARFFVRLVGRNGARIFYGILGAALITLGLLGKLGII